MTARVAVNPPLPYGRERLPALHADLKAGRVQHDDEEAVSAGASHGVCTPPGSYIASELGDDIHRVMVGEDAGNLNEIAVRLSRASFYDMPPGSKPEDMRFRSGGEGSCIFLAP
jgi:hypothetical protein